MERLNIDNSFHDSDPQDPEISLGAATILGIFLALTLVCALFFGLGYSMGRRSAQATAGAAAAEPTATSTPNKPAPGSAVPAPAPPPAAVTPAPNPAPSNAVTVPLTPASPAQNPEKIVGKPAAAPTIPTGNFIVQIAAVSHREDAESLINALEQRGYVVFIRNEPQDKLLHVQVGPFPNRRDADAMRQHLLYDGYNAIVK